MRFAPAPTVTAADVVNILRAFVFELRCIATRTRRFESLSAVCLAVGSILLWYDESVQSEFGTSFR